MSGPPLRAVGEGWRENERVPPWILLSMVLVIATAGLVYELVMASVASYVLGDSVRQFSLVIGVYLSALGLGAYLSRFVVKRLSIAFVDVELAAALVGGGSASLLFLAFGFTSVFQLVLYTVVIATGVLVGIELPLLIRILERRLSLRELIARALTFDYAGALVGSLAFSLILVPDLGLSRSAVACGLLNAGAGLFSTWVLPAEDDAERDRMIGARIRAVVVIAVLVIVWLAADRSLSLAEQRVYPGRIVLSQQSPYQRIVVTRQNDHFDLYLSGHLQFSSSDEHRYHEALVHPAMAASESREKILVAGGGDGLAVREVLRWPEVRTVTLVDLDAAITDLARHYAPLARLNERALDDPRVRVENQDAMVWLRDGTEGFGVIVLDFPDPTQYAIGKLYSDTFYELARRRLAPGGALVAQASSPFFGRRTFWCVVTTLERSGFAVQPYHAYVPSFGDWGFALAKTRPFEPPRHVAASGLRFLDDRVLADLFRFPKDTTRLATDVNRLENQALVAYYLDEWPD